MFPLKHLTRKELLSWPVAALGSDFVTICNANWFYENISISMYTHWDLLFHHNLVFLMAEGYIPASGADDRG